jgi:hypothetical protein
VFVFFRMNPLGLNPERFTVAERQDEGIIAFGQLELKQVGRWFSKPVNKSKGYNCKPIIIRVVNSRGLTRGRGHFVEGTCKVAVIQAVVKHQG